MRVAPPIVILFGHRATRDEHYISDERSVERALARYFFIRLVRAHAQVWQVDLDPVLARNAP